MGRYLACCIATTITVEKVKDRFSNPSTKNEIINMLSEKINLGIYNIKEDEENVYFELKEDVFEKNATSFIKEQLKKIDLKHIKEDYEEICKLEGKKYNELMKVAKKKSIESFQYLNGSIFCNDASYLTNGEYNCYADVIIYLIEGKVIFESYYTMFKYFRKLILESTDNPIKDAVVVTITG